MMNMDKEKMSGFTLIELIAVIAILAVLSAVAVPVYSGYMKKTYEARDLAELNVILNAVNAAFAIEDVMPKIVRFTEPKTIRVSIGNGMSAMNEEQEKAFYAFYGSSVDEFELNLKCGSTAVWTRSTSKWVITGPAD